MSIYQEIWDADQAGNGVPAIRQADSSLKDPTVGYVIVNEPPDNDSETKVLSEVVIPDSKRTTYDLCDRLFDNYALDPGLRELIYCERVKTGLFKIVDDRFKRLIYMTITAIIAIKKSSNLSRSEYN